MAHKKKSKIIRNFSPKGPYIKEQEQRSLTYWRIKLPFRLTAGQLVLVQLMVVRIHQG